jgi:ferredoxin
MTIAIDTGRCIGCGLCAWAVPQVFRVVGETSTVLAQPEDPRDTKVLDAANSCPGNAITIQS